MISLINEFIGHCESRVLKSNDVIDQTCIMSNIGREVIGHNNAG